MAEPRAFVCGHPIAHSRSPLIHRHWLNEHGLAGSYEAIDVAPAAFEAFAQAMPGRFVGGNVTIPHNPAAFAAAVRHDAAAAAIGAVNTLWFEAGELVGGNTDAHGFAANLDAQAAGWDARGGAAAVLGAGGAAGAVVFALLARGFAEIRVVNRTAARAAALADRFGPRVTMIGWDDVKDALTGADLLVNTTALGMPGRPALAVNLGPLPPDAVVTDLVYVPLRTPLLAAAEARGLRTVDGLGMLLHQAAPGFARWFGVHPAVTPALRAAVVADLARAS